MNKRVKLPKKTLDVQVTTMDAVLEFQIEVVVFHPFPRYLLSVCVCVCVTVKKHWTTNYAFHVKSIPQTLHVHRLKHCVSYFMYVSNDV